MREVAETFPDPEIPRVIDRHLSPQGPVLFEVLLDVGVFVIHMEARVHAFGDHARTIPDGRRWGRPSDPYGKEQSDAVRSPQVEIFSDHGFEEESSLHGSIEDLRETDFELIDRQTVIVAGATVGRGERPGETMRPAVKEGLDVGGPQRIAGGWQRDGIGTREKPVVERLEPNALATQLLLHPFVAVETEFHRIRQIGADLHERRTPVAIVDVEVVLIDRDPLARELEADLDAGTRLLMGFFKRAHLLLRDAEHDDALASREARAMGGGDRIFVLPGFEVHDGNRVARDKLLNGGDEAVVHRPEQGGRRNRMAEIVAEEVAEAA